MNARYLTIEKADDLKEQMYALRTIRYDVVLTGEIIHVGLAHHAKVVEMMWIQK